MANFCCAAVGAAVRGVARPPAGERSAACMQRSGMLMRAEEALRQQAVVMRGPARAITTTALNC